MATVYLATDRRLDREVALKVMHPHLADGTDVVARFRREARAAARLTHPGIVAVLDQGTEGDLSYLTMEYVPGRNLRAELHARGSLPLGEALDVGEAVLDALAAAHRAGLVHRDVKPENVLVTPEGRVKVADFGLARAVTEATAASTGTLLGTVAYLSPEIVTSGEADARADVYAAGILLYEAITGSQPFTGTSPIQVAYQHVHEDVPAPSDRVPWLPIEVDDLLAALTARDADERPVDAGAAVVELRRTRAAMDDRALALRADVPGAGEEIGVEDDPDESDDAVDDAFDGIPHSPTTRLDDGPGTGTIALPIGAVSPPAAEAPPAPRRRRSPRRRIIAWVLALLLVTVAGAGGWYVTLGPGAPVLVPDLAGEEADDAAAALTELDLEVSRSEEHHDSIPAGQVVGTDPSSGSRLARGAAIDLVVSLGIRMVEVPELVGVPEDEVLAALASVGLTAAEPDRDHDRNVPEGAVVSANVEAGDSVPHDTVVELTVSEGPEPVTVTELLGAHVDDAVEELTRVLDITREEITVTEEFSDDVAAQHVISQSVVGPSVQGTPVTIVVSKGPELFEVPDVVGEQFVDAEALLTGLGFEVAREDVFGGLFGTVRLQSVEAGSMQPRGTVITLTVV